MITRQQFGLYSSLLEMTDAMCSMSHSMNSCTCGDAVAMQTRQ